MNGGPSFAPTTELFHFISIVCSSVFIFFKDMRIASVLWDHVKIEM